jgi:hypothetical protein
VGGVGIAQRQDIDLHRHAGVIRQEHVVEGTKDALTPDDNQLIVIGQQPPYP